MHFFLVLLLNTKGYTESTGADKAADAEKLD